MSEKAAKIQTKILPGKPEYSFIKSTLKAYKNVWLFGSKMEKDIVMIRTFFVHIIKQTVSLLLPCVRNFLR